MFLIYETFTESLIFLRKALQNIIHDHTLLHQQPPPRRGAVPDPVLGRFEMAVGLPEGPSYPGHSPSFFRYAAH